MATALGLAPAAARAEIPPELAGRPIVAIEVAGESAALAPTREIGIPLGSPLHRALVRSALQKLLASGRWTDAQVDAVQVPGGGVKLIVWLTARIELRRIDVSGNRSLDGQTIREALAVAPGSEVSPQQLPALSRAVAKIGRASCRERV